MSELALATRPALSEVATSVVTAAVLPKVKVLTCHSRIPTAPAIEAGLPTLMVVKGGLPTGLANRRKA